MKKVLSFSLFIALIIPLLSGCWDYTEVNMQDYAFGMSIDRNDNEYTVCIETLKVKGSPEEAGSAGTVIKTQGENLFDAIRNAITHAGKKLYWGHFQLAIIGESAAKKDLQEILDVFSRAQDVYLNVALILAKGVSGEEIINAKLPKETMVTDHIMDIFDNQKPSRHFKPAEIWQLYRDMSFSDTYIIPTIELNDDKVPEVNGSAVFNAGELAGFLTGEETVIYSLLSEDTSGGFLPFINVSRDLNVSLEISQSRISTKAELNSDGKPTLKIKSKILVSLSRTSGKCNLMDEKTQTQIGEAAQREVQSRMKTLCTRIQNENLGDPLHWAGAFQSSKPEWWRENSENWQTHLKSITIDWDVKVSLNSSGMTKHTLSFN